MLTAVIWGWILVATNPQLPADSPPLTAFDYTQQQSCEDDKTALLEKFPAYRAWCIPIPKPERAPAPERRHVDLRHHHHHARVVFHHRHQRTAQAESAIGYHTP